MAAARQDMARTLHKIVWLVLGKYVWPWLLHSMCFYWSG